MGERQRWKILRLGFWLGLLPLAGCMGMFFYPTKTLVTTPADWGLAWEDVYLQAPDGTRLHGWWLPAKVVAPSAAKGTVYFLHGNAENISTHIASVAWLPDEGYNVFLLDYRGYGRSEGEPAMPALLTDVAAGLDWVAQRADSAPLFLLGQSLGGSLGGFVAATRKHDYPQLTAVVLDAAFAGYARIAREAASRSLVTRGFAGAVAASLPSEYDLIDVVGELAPIPVMIIHGELDQIVPSSHSRDLFAAAREPKSLLTYEGPHIATFGDRDNRQHLLDFFARSSD